MLTARLVRGAAVAMALALFVATASAQGFRRGNRFFEPIRSPTPESFDGSFNFCRIMFARAPDGDGGGWQVDYPRADINLSIRLSELTKTHISRQASGEPNHLVMDLNNPAIFNCPFIMMTEVGAAYLGPTEAAHLREYLLKGGFLWADDFWGSYAWDHWVAELEKVLPPGEYPIKDLPLTHPLFHAQFEVARVPQIPSINAWGGPGGSTSERGYDSAEPHARGISDSHGRLMVLITHNTDFGDAFEREGDDPRYFYTFSVEGYAFGINALLYGLTH
jgi:Domain of unknown function (DUF4159)